MNLFLMFLFYMSDSDREAMEYYLICANLDIYKTTNDS